ncbi:unnamed protein product [Schistosoma curassoni]|uniref:Reverse transcriptase domain-containing protein n=1 Tax=Schistosoma curassoni TaxID=6186 RepID=A0A183L1U2_9TREM|nr:unnamed protein product [Schistosoma curassoni]
MEENKCRRAGKKDTSSRFQRKKIRANVKIAEASYRCQYQRKSSTVFLNQTKDAVDTQLRDQQAGFRKDRSCTDQIATLRIIVEQSVEWNSLLYTKLIDYEKAFNSVDRRTLWKRLRLCGVPEKIVSIVTNSCDGLQCEQVHGGQLTDAFQVRIGVRQGCLLSPFLFLLVIDWIVKTSTSEGKNGIQWTAQNQLDDLDFADDLALLSHTHEQMQIKTASVSTVSASVGLNIRKGKPRSSSTTQRTPIQSHLIAKLWKMWNPLRT